ncbi:NAD-dependent epimerase/dehydratase family protein [Mucilaginibacter paludis]|uniref:NAD-dependent epimerase/dehydratase n=1 Tax=Mucilaginibacter paludis DSM 18603 TaxID=714943 RepID=H1Y3F5_9SPHI|nr:NAD-dependent epimerase/dehydratase family protein [Mucilaginibacter paludis]EHQ29723.1 NAD-dependent epimerase/dehydratase [Mucilaginibacter paludis DSM 18603]
MKPVKILVIGALGQLGTELTAALRKQHGSHAVIAADRHTQDTVQGPYVQLDVLNFGALADLVRREKVTQIYLLAAMLSASGEQNIHAAWELNMQGLIHVLKIAAAQRLDKVFWPSSIAVFGPGSPKHLCPQDTFIQPNTIYGISKRSGEYWCNYYFEKHGVDVRSLRYPGLISHSTPPGGGTTDYAVDIFYKALDGQTFRCFLKEDTCLPMMYMPDAVRATLELMEAPKEQVRVRTSYNLAAMSFSPCDLAAAIRERLPAFDIQYEPDYRQAIADSWPASIQDASARQDWGWKPGYDLNAMVTEMLQQLQERRQTPAPPVQTHHDQDQYVFTKLSEP